MKTVMLYYSPTKLSKNHKEYTLPDGEIVYLRAEIVKDDLCALDNAKPLNKEVVLNSVYHPKST